MRSLRQVQTDGDTMYALDDDGVLWRGQLVRRGDPGQTERPLQYDETGAILAQWRPIVPPPDDPPFLDTRDRLTRLEDRIRRDQAERELLRERLEGLPPLENE